MSQSKSNMLPAILMIVGGFLMMNGGGFDFSKFLPLPKTIYPNAWAIVVYESEGLKDNAELATTIQNADLKQRCESVKLKLRFLDVDLPEAKVYKDLKLELPAILIVDPLEPKAKLVRSIKFTTEQEMIDFIQAETGKKIDGK